MVESSAFDRKFSLIISGTSLVIHVSLFFQPTELYFHSTIGCEGSGKLVFEIKIIDQPLLTMNPQNSIFLYRTRAINHRSRLVAAPLRF